MAEWYYKIAEQVVGPLSADQLKALADGGRLAPGDPIAKSPDGPWVAASRVKGLFEVAAVDDEPAEAPTPSGTAAEQVPPAASPEISPGQASSKEPPVPQPPVVMSSQTPPPQQPAPNAPPVVESSPGGGLGIQTEAVTATQRFQKKKREEKPKEPLTKKQKNARLVKWLAIAIVAGIVVLVSIPYLRSLTRPAPEVVAEKNPIPEDVNLAGAEDSLEGSFNTASRTPRSRPASTEPTGETTSSADSSLDAMEQVFEKRGAGKVVAKPVRVVLDRPLMTKPDGNAAARPSNRLLLVEMELNTDRGNDSARFHGWAKFADDVSLTDNQGVEYAVRTPRRFGNRFVDGQCHEMVFLSADKPVTDVIVFAWPEDEAPSLPSTSEEELKLRLPKNAYGEEGELLFAIPLSQIDVTEEALKEPPAKPEEMPATSDNVMEDDGGPIKIPGLMN